MAERSDAITFKGRTRIVAYRYKPMLCGSVDEPFDGKAWLFEIKWDGYRAIAEVDHQNVNLYSRNFQSYNRQFPNIVEALQKLNLKGVFDGEIVILDELGRSHFQMLQNYQKFKKGIPFFYLFDLLSLEGKDLRDLPLIKRKALLFGILKQHQSNVLRYSDHLEEKGKQFYEAATQMSLEGIIAKQKKSPYLHQRSNYWLKIKIRPSQEVIIAGFSKPQGGRQYFGALLLGVYDKGLFRYVGRVGTGFDERALKRIYNLMKPLTREKCPFDEIPSKERSSKDVIWIEPKLICEVVYREWTDTGIMRQTAFKGLRCDKQPSEVVRENLHST